MPGDPLTSEPAGATITAAVSREIDLEELTHYYESNPHRNYAFRRRATAEMCGKGGFIVLRRGRDIVGAGGIFPVGDRWVELGQARITLNGLGLYSTLINMRLLRSMELFPAAATVFAEVDAPNRRVMQLLKDHFFVEFEPDPLLCATSIAALPAGKRPSDLGYGFNWLRASDQSFAASKAWYLKANRDGQRPRDATRVETISIAAAGCSGRGSR